MAKDGVKRQKPLGGKKIRLKSEYNKAPLQSKKAPDTLVRGSSGIYWCG